MSFWQRKVSRPSFYVYPNTAYQHTEGSNTYIKNLIQQFGRFGTVINAPSKIGLLDALLKVLRTDVICFNWIEDLPHRRFGFMQIPLLWILLIVAKIRGILVIWFIHNRISHNKDRMLAKRMILSTMRIFSDVMFSHSESAKNGFRDSQFYNFDHPVEEFTPVDEADAYIYDLIIWGSVSKYKGVLDFVRFVKDDSQLSGYNILIAGRFDSTEYFNSIDSIKSRNVILVNKLLTEAELVDFLSKSRYVLFTYNSDSVLSSAALCKTLSFGKEIIGPEIGSFRELGEKGYIHTYKNFQALKELMYKLKNEKMSIDRREISQYAKSTSWDEFGNYLNGIIISKN